MQIITDTEDKLEMFVPKVKKKSREVEIRKKVYDGRIENQTLI